MLFDALFPVAFMFGVPAYFVLQPVLALRYRGGWRMAAMVPLLGSAPCAVWSLFALSQGSNLWPLTLIFFAPIGTVYLGGVWLAHRIAA